MSKATLLPQVTAVRHPVTRFFHWVPDAQPITLRFDDDEGSPEPTEHLYPEERIGGLYELLGEALAHSGEADVYRCRHLENDQVLILKWYRQHSQPKREVVAQLHGLDHPHLITMLDHGQWQGRFYEVSQLCLGGVATDAMPMSEAQCREYLPGIVSAMQFMHSEGIIHRDIKPGNLFFSDLERRNMVIGDFGISSYLGLNNQDLQMTQTAAQMTLDYAAPELINRHEVGPATDYYALGITLLHLHSGHSPFQSLSYNDILVAHLRAKIPLPDHLSDDFKTLVLGLTHYQIEHRWGYRQVMAWLRGEKVALAAMPRLSSGEGRAPYPALEEADTPAKLAARLDQVDALTQLVRGDIQRWLFDHFDAQLADRIAELEKNALKHPQLALAHLPFILDAKSPLRIGQHAIESLREFALRLRNLDEDLRQAWSNKSIIYWLKEGKHGGKRNAQLLEQVEEIYQKSQGRTELALFSLRYLLDPKQPLQVGTWAIRQVSDIQPLFMRHGKNFVRALASVVLNERLEQWLLMTQPEDWQQHCQMVGKVRTQLSASSNIIGYCVLWYFAPDVPLPFAGQQYTDAKDLALRVMDDEQHWAMGLNYFQRGWFIAWLLGTGQLTNMEALNELMFDSERSAEIQLDVLLRLMNPDVGAPRMVVQPEFIKFGVLQQGETRQKILSINQAGNGYLHGLLKLESFKDGIMLNAFDFEGQRSEINVTLETLQLQPGEYKNHLTIQSNAGVRTITIYYTIKAPTKKPWWNLG